MDQRDRPRQAQNHPWRCHRPAEHESKSLELSLERPLPALHPTPPARGGRDGNRDDHVNQHIDPMRPSGVYKAFSSNSCQTGGQFAHSKGFGAMLCPCPVSEVRPARRPPGAGFPTAGRSLDQRVTACASADESQICQISADGCQMGESQQREQGAAIRRRPAQMGLSNPRRNPPQALDAQRRCSREAKSGGRRRESHSSELRIAA